MAAFERQINQVVIVGAGWVGRQIAMQLAAYGCRTWLFDRYQEMAEQAMAWANEQAQRLVQRQVWTENKAVSSRQNLKLVKRLDELDVVPQLVIECVPEQASLKKRVLKEMSETFSKDTIIASNSSYFTPSMFQGAVKFPERFVHYHFHVPVFLSAAVDIMPWPGTDLDIVARLVELSNRIGQKPLVCQREHPGYVFNWLLQALLKAAMELAEQGVAEPKEIDERWIQLSGMQRGPFWIMDQIGLDVIQQVLQNGRFTQAMPAEPLIGFLEKWVSAGKLGQKSGEGFYPYSTQLLDWDTTIHGS